MSHRVGRRVVLCGGVGVPLLAWARPETLPKRAAEFTEIGNSIHLRLFLPGLIRPNDQGALASIDSGFDTTIEYELHVWEYGTRRLIASATLVRKLRRDPWTKKYLLRTREVAGWSRRNFVERAAAIEAAVLLDGLKVCPASALDRGGDRGPYYFVEVLAMRNPLRRRGEGGSGTEVRRGQGRDADWFRRLVETLAGERAQAEKVLHVRTNPFYLLAQ